jgi:hypothetical protein
MKRRGVPQWTTRSDSGRFHVASFAFWAALILVCGCGKDAPSKTAPTALERPELPRLRDVLERTGIDFVHTNGPTKSRYMMETLGGGVAVIDFDGDGLPDLYFVGSGGVPAHTDRQGPSGSRLYKNLGGWKFQDVTEHAGVGGRGYAMGAVVGDYDGDGDLDIYVTSYGSNTLYQNQGDGTFRDVTKEAGVDDARWSTGAAFLDYDGDGHLDLFVQNYVVYTVEDHRPYSRKGVSIYPTPDLFDPVACSLFHNKGDGTFEDVSVKSGIAAHLGKGLGVLVDDFDGDGRPDIYCANDTAPNFLFHNKGDGTFEELGLVSGAGYSAEGREEAGMGVDAADLDGDGLLDIVVTNFQDESTSIYRGEGRMFFTEVSAGSGTALATLSTLGFGVRLLDLDGDMLPDMVMANGHVYDNAEQVVPPATFAQPPLCFRGLGACRFEDVTRLQPPEFRRARVGRGLATADLEGDGDLDVVIGNLGAAPSVFENDGGNRKSWTSVHAVGTKRDSSAIGARVTVEVGGHVQFQDVRSGGSYLSQSDLTLTFGLGDVETIDRVAVRWPDGKVEEARGVPARKHLVFVEASGLKK